MTDQREVDRQREELRRALNEIEDRINPQKVAKRTTERAKASIERDPTPWVAAAAGAVVLVAGTVALAIFGKRS